MQTLSHLSPVIDRYDALILDLWGVIHDGSHLYPGVHGTLTKLRAAGKKIVMLSNAPRRTHRVEAVLNQLGVENALYDGVMSSGEAGYRWLQSGQATWGNRYYYIGPGKDADVLDGLDYRRVDEVKEADFLLNVGFGSEDQSTEDFLPLLRAAGALNLPMLCLNPDMEVVKITGERYPCAGVIGCAYRDLGGDVIWFGKPYRCVYELSLELLGPVEKSRILAIGDSIGTDIKGAVEFGLDCALVKGGILKQNTQAEIERICEEQGVLPTYLMPALVW